MNPNEARLLGHHSFLSLRERTFFCGANADDAKLRCSNRRNSHSATKFADPIEFGGNPRG